ncbi:MAG: murein transglycosylase A [Duodenibacillus sp.]|nr:murein transglycosylase A [Duodenibacillus sp.]
MRAAAAAAAAALLGAACTSLPPTGEPAADAPEPEATVQTRFARFTSTPFARLPASRDEDWEPALAAFRASCRKIGRKAVWEQACRAAEDAGSGGARAFFARSFTAWRVSGLAGGEGEGLMTGYYEPELRGSRERSEAYPHPVLGLPDDLIVVDMADVYPKLRGMKLRGKVVGRRLVAYDDRRGIRNRPELLERALCWVDDATEAFFLQVQGSGRIRLDDGSVMRVGFADQNGRPYRAVASKLIADGVMQRHQASMQAIKAWVNEHPDRADALFDYNPSYVFFREIEGLAPEAGPVGAQGVPLTAGASVAVDLRYWPLGLPFLVSAEQDLPPLRFARPVVAQDTGGAIRGLVRFDYFWGSGDAAGAQAGRQKSRAAAWALVPKGFTPADL